MADRAALGASFCVGLLEAREVRFPFLFLQDEVFRGKVAPPRFGGDLQPAISHYEPHSMQSPSSSSALHTSTLRSRMKPLVRLTGTARPFSTLHKSCSAHKPSARFSSRTTQISSPQLCDDILQQLGPTLRQHEGCDLIDISPAGCLWREHLNSAVNPRRHIVVGPQPSEPPDTSPPKEGRYAYARSLNEVLDPGMGLLGQEIVACKTEKYAKLNKSLLISVNLSGSLLSTSRYIGSAAGYFFHDLYASLFGLRQDIFRYGLVRVLAWIPDEAARVFLPRGVDDRTKLSIKLEAAFSITQIAGASQANVLSRKRRWYDLELANDNALPAAAVPIPSERLDLPPLPLASSLAPDPAVFRYAKYTTDATFIDDWLALDAKLREAHPGWIDTEAYQNKPTRSLAPKEPPDMREWRAYINRARAIHWRYQRIANIINLQRDLELRYQSRLKTEEGAGEGAFQRFQTEAAELKAQCDSLSRDGRIQARKAIDDYRAYHSSPRALEWNKRLVNPLVVQPVEFTPTRPLALLDLTPRADFRRLLDTDSKATCFDYILNRLTVRWSSSVYDALESMLQGGVDDFVATVPSLKDPRKGGWLDLTNLRVRSLPASTFIDIAIAYERWPLRRNTTKMMFEMSKDSTFSPDDD